ncbi:MAG: metallophosphoesterase family protein [Planctomycetota bacterium]|jgi:hypothetical protein
MRRFLFPLTLAACLGLLPCPARGQGIPPHLKKEFEKLLRELEVKPQEIPPDWYDPSAKPLFRFVQMSDFHLTHRLHPLLTAALEFINKEVNPTFVAITGDNAVGDSVKSHTILKDLLDKNLKAPTYLIKGDNWPDTFPDVFGSTRYAFECGGVRFVFSGLDTDGHWVGGTGTFKKDTWDWMKKEFAPENPMSVLFLLHENIQPPVFLDALKMDTLLEKSPCLAATFTGHLHADLAFQAGRVKHILAPGFGPHRKHGFKVCDVHEKTIVIRTVEWKKDAYRWAQKYQKIDLPHPANKPASDPIENFRSLPSRKIVYDKSLDQKWTAIIPLQMGLFAKRVGLYERFSEMLKSMRKKKPEPEEEDF